MLRKLVSSTFLVVFVLSCFANDTSSVSKAEANDHVALRMIGHQVLLSVGDSTSRVLPVKTEGNTHTISFERAFSFDPDVISHVIDSVIDATGLATEYIVQLITCDSNLVAHSYKMSSAEDESLLACKGRNQPEACYYLKIIDLNKPETNSKTELVHSRSGDYSEAYQLLTLLAFSVMLLSGLIVYLLKRKSTSTTESGLIGIGKYQFNPNTMELIFHDTKTELTSKESDLLQLLSASANCTVERETILTQVWGDDGDYVGRTLDVFISKLRKKLDGDDSVKIANIRGVGYKLIIDA